MAKSTAKKNARALSPKDKPDELRAYTVTDADATPHEYTDVRVLVTDDGGLVLIGDEEVVQAMFAPNFWSSVELTPAPHRELLDSTEREGEADSITGE